MSRALQGTSMVARPSINFAPNYHSATILTHSDSHPLSLVADIGLSWKGKAGLNLGEEPHIINVSPNDPKRLMCFWRTQAGVIARAYR